MPSYWPDKPHKPAHRRLLNKIGYWLYLHFGLRSSFWTRVWGEREVFRILRAIEPVPQIRTRVKVEVLFPRRLKWLG